MNAANEFDLGPLIWVKGEIDLALSRAADALKQLSANPAETAQLRFAQTHLHQAHGALAIVGLDGVTQVSESVEALLGDMEQGRAAPTPMLLDLGQQSIAMLRRYLDDLANGATNQPLKLLPIYDQVQRARNTAPAVPSDLFFPDLSLRPPKREMETAALADEQSTVLLKAARSRFERGFLQWLRSADSLAGLSDMREAVSTIERVQSLPGERTVWWITLGFLDVLAHKAVPVDLAVKRLCARIDTQMRRFVEGTAAVAERLLRDLLYYVAIAPDDSEQVREIKRVYDLDRLVPQTVTTDLAPLQPVLVSLRESIQQAKECWNKFCAGAAVALPQFDDQTAQIGSRIADLPQSPITRLLAAIGDTARWLRKDPLQHSDTVAMELATALLLAETAVENFGHIDSEFPQQVEIVEERLARLRRGEILAPLDAPLLGEMSRQAQDKLFLAQVAREILTNLSQIEQSLDAYFRDSSRGKELLRLTTTLKQVEGALTMLGQENAVTLLRECSESIARFAAAETAPPQSEFEQVAHTLSGLGFFVEALQHGPADLDAILYPERAKARKSAAAATVEQELEQKRGEAQALVEQLKEKPQDASLRQELKQTFETIRQEANLVADAKLEQQAKEALAALAAQTATAGTERFEKAVADIAPQAAPAAPPPAAPAPATEEAVDSELLGIFLEEANDVLVTIDTNLDSLRAEPHNHEVMTTIRRAFHTLKGSGRMVGLKELGEAAWSAEQVMNQWLRLEQDATPALHQFIGDSHRLLQTWVRQLEAGGGTHMDASALFTQAEMLKSGGEAAPPAAPSEAAPPVAAEVPPAPPPEEQIHIGDLVLSRTLYDMFLGEARQHLATLRHELARMHINPTLLPTEQTMRAAHTLGGIAGTVGLQAVHDLARNLEHALQRLSAANRAPDSDQSEVLNSAASVLEGMVKAVADKRRPQPLSDLLEWLDDIAPAAAPAATAPQPPVEEILALEEEEQPAIVAPQAVLAPPMAAAAETPIQEERRKLRMPDDIDAQLLPIFLEEATDLIRETGTELHNWRTAPADSNAPRALARLLHTLKGSARMAGAMALGELVHNLENRVELAFDKQDATPQFFDDCNHSLDRASALLDQLRVAPVAEAAAAPAAEATAAPATPVATAEEEEVAAARATLRVRADLVDRFVNEAGEISIARSRIEGEMRTLRASLLDLTENVIRLRNQLREVEIQADSQMQSRLARAEAQQAEFDPLEMDRFTRLQELTRMMAESVNDVSTVQHTLLRNLDAADAALTAQGRLARELQQSLMNVRMVPFTSVADRLYRIVRQTAKELNRKANLDIRGGQLELDRSVLEKMTGPLEHLLRNAISHGLEDGAERIAQGKGEIGEIRLALSQEGNEIAIEFADDGRGLDFARIRERALKAGLLASDAEPTEAQLIELIFRPGFSTAAELSAIAGRGVGMDVVKSTVYALGGRIEVNSVAGKGTRFRILLPQSLVVMQALLARVSGRTYAIPSAMVEQVLELKPDALQRMREAGEAEWLGNKYPFRYLARLLGDSDSQPPPARYSWVILTRASGIRVATQVDELRGNQEIVIKKTGAQLARVIGIAGATVLADGEISLILNPVALLVREPAAPQRAAGGEAAPAHAAPPQERQPSVMVVDDSLTVRKITSRLLEREGFRVITAKDGVDALEQLLDVVPDVMLVDIEMPRMDGFDLTRNVRGDPRLKGVPIIMITSRLADKHRSYAKEIGVNHYLGKPYQEDELLALIRSYTEAVVAA